MPRRNENYLLERIYLRSYVVGGWQGIVGRQEAKERLSLILSNRILPDSHTGLFRRNQEVEAAWNMRMYELEQVRLGLWCVSRRGGRSRGTISRQTERRGAVLWHSNRSRPSQRQDKPTNRAGTA